MDVRAYGSLHLDVAGFRQSRADFQAEIVHRRLFPDRSAFAARLPLGLFFRTGHVDRDLHIDFRMQMHGRLMKAESS